MTTTQTILHGKDTAAAGELYMSFELGDKSWKLTISDGRRGPSRYSVDAGDTAAVLDCVAKARGRSGVNAEAKVHSCYEAGRDGWWLHRWLIENGIDNVVVDSASIEVNRRARRAKTDRLDGDKLLAMLLRHHAGERVWSVLHEPTPEDEDGRRAHRELARLVHERIAHTNRISSLLVLHNLRPRVIIGGRDWASWWDAHGLQVPPELRAELERESARLALVKQQIKALEAARRHALEDGKQPMVAQLAKLRAIGPKGAWVLVKELFGWRRFANRRELAGCLGLAPSLTTAAPARSSKASARPATSEREPYLSNSPGAGCDCSDSALTEWFNRRFAAGGTRMRRVGIVALARRLAIALWRYLQHGEIPAGATLKPATV